MLNNEDYQDLDLGPLLRNDDLIRKIIHCLQQGQNIDYFLTTEFRFLGNYYQSICLGLLFYWGRETGQTRSQGLPLMGLDEAERLDENALLTVRGLLDRVGCQLLVALPRTLQVPSSLCHLLTPLSQGVTHVSVFHKEGEG